MVGIWVLSGGNLGCACDGFAWHSRLFLYMPFLATHMFYLILILQIVKGATRTTHFLISSRLKLNAMKRNLIYEYAHGNGSKGLA